jgi:CubicO group peptidase (beta-lactamase class C family)
LIGHSGGILGYSTWVIYAPEEDATIVVATNRASTTGGTAEAIFNNLLVYLFPDRFPSAG